MKILEDLSDSKWEAFKWEINWKWQHFIIYPLRSAENGIKNLWKYRKVIWEDRWWDYSFLMTMIKFKLKDTAKGWDGAHYINSDQDQTEILRLVEILNEIEDLEDDGTFTDKDSIKLKEKYQEFGEALFSIREFDRGGHKVKTNLVQLLWD